MSKEYFKIGEFAKICGVKKATLIHYAQIGLLVPKKVGENGYSFYAVSQIYDFELINVLKNLNVPLADIKDYLDNKNGDLLKSEEILRKKLVEIEEMKRKIISAEHLIQNTIKDIEDIKHQKIGVVEEIYQESPEYYFVYEMPYRDAASVYRMGNPRDIIKHIQDSFLNEDINVMEIVRNEDIMNGTFKKTYGAFRAKAGVDREAENIIEKPAGTYLTIADESSGEKIVTLYKILKEYADKNGYTICGNAYERDLLSHVVERNREKYLVRCYIQVEKEKK